MLEELIEDLIDALHATAEDVHFYIMTRHPAGGFVWAFRIRDRRFDDEVWETGLGRTPELAVREVLERMRASILH